MFTLLKCEIKKRLGSLFHQAAQAVGSTLTALPVVNPTSASHAVVIYLYYNTLIIITRCQKADFPNAISAFPSEIIHLRCSLVLLL